MQTTLAVLLRASESYCLCSGMQLSLCQCEYNCVREMGEGNSNKKGNDNLVVV